MIFTKLWYILFDCICTTVNTFVPLLYSKIKITWNIYHLASEWVNTFICMKRKYGKCLEVEEGAGRVVPYTGFGSHPWALPLWLSRLRTQLVSMRMWVQPLTSLSGLRIWHCHKWQGRSQMRLGSAVAVAQASSCSCDVALSLGTSICHRCDPKMEKKSHLYYSCGVSSQRDGYSAKQPEISQGAGWIPCGFQLTLDYQCLALLLPLNLSHFFFFSFSWTTGRNPSTQWGEPKWTPSALPKPRISQCSGHPFPDPSWGRPKSKEANSVGSGTGLPLQDLLARRICAN